LSDKQINDIISSISLLKWLVDNHQSQI
jgi:hypothetical protein